MGARLLRIGGWLAVGMMIAPLGCRWCRQVPLPTIRGQAPLDDTITPPVTTGRLGSPLAGLSTPPVTPPAPTTPAPTASSPREGTEFLGQDRTAEATAVQTASYLSGGAPLARLPELLQRAAPRIRIAAVIGANQVITDQEVREAVYQRLAEYRDLPGPLRAAKQNELYSAELRRIIERELLLADMQARLKKLGKLSAWEDIREFAETNTERLLQQIRRGYNAANEEEFVNILRAQGLTLQVVRRQLIRQIMAEEYARTLLKDRVRAPGFAEIRAYYETHAEEFRIEDHVRWQHIFISYQRYPTPQQARQLAEQLRQAALDGADFATLSRQHDCGLAGGNGGFGIGHTRGTIQPLDLEPTIWTLAPGQVSEVITTPTGCHLVKVVERQYAGIRPFDQQVQDQIREKLLRKAREAEYHKLIAELWRTIGVQVLTAE